MLRTLLFLCLGSLSAAAVTAQDEPPVPWVRLNVVHVQPEMVEEFVAIQRELSARAQRDNVPWRTVIRTEVFGNTYRFLIATPVETLASFDGGNDADLEMRSLINRVQRSVTSRQSYAVRMLPHMANRPPEDEAPGLMVVNIAKVAPGREQEYLDIMSADFLPHFDEAGVHHVSGSLAFGGEGGFIHVFYVGDFAELDKGSPVMRALGTEGAQAVTAKLAGIVTSNELWTARVLPEVSFGPSSDDDPNP